MGQKVHPTGFRLGIKVGERSVKDWQGRWFATGHEYASLLLEDIKVRQHIMTRMADAGVSKVEIERSANMITVTIHAAKPGIVIGKSGVKVEELRRTLEAMTGKRIRVTIQEIRQPEIDAFLVARSIADQLEKRVAFRRAMKQAVQRAQRFGAKGVRVQVSGRLGGSEMSRREWDRWGRVPLHTLRADIDYGQTEAHTTYGIIGVKVWIYRGDFTPYPRQPRLRQPRQPCPPKSTTRRAESSIPARSLVNCAHAEPAKPKPRRLLRLSHQRPRHVLRRHHPRGLRHLRHGPRSRAMLQPKRMKHRKMMKRTHGGLGGVALRGNTIAFGEYAIRTLEPAWITARQIEAARRTITHHLKRGGKVWIRIFPDKVVTSKPAETRMGSGKGAPDHYVAVVKPGHVLFEIGGVRQDLAHEALRLASHKLPVATKFMIKEGLEIGGEETAAAS